MKNMILSAAVLAALAAPATVRGESALGELERAAELGQAAAQNPDAAAASAAGKSSFDGAPAAGLPAIAVDGDVRRGPLVAPLMEKREVLAATPPARAPKEEGSRWGLRAFKAAAGLVLIGLGVVTFTTPALVAALGLGMAAVGAAFLIYALAAGDDTVGVVGMGLAAMAGFSFIPFFGPPYVGVMLASAGALLVVSAIRDSGKD